MTNPSAKYYTTEGTCSKGHPWTTSTSIAPNGYRFCSVCRKQSKDNWRHKRITAPERLLDSATRLDVRLDKTPGHGPDGECWIYTGGVNKHGYGKIGKDGKIVFTHRLAYEIANGPVPEGLRVCHHCDNPPCCRPDHLFAGTQGDNNADRDKKGRTRGAFGERNYNTKMSWEKVHSLRAEYSTGKISMASLALRYGIGPTTVHQIVTRETWKEPQDVSSPA